MDLIARINELLDQRGWSKYHLAKEAKLSQSTISSMINRGNAPSIATIERCCAAFGITLVEFFAVDGQDDRPTSEEWLMLREWRSLSSDMQDYTRRMIEVAALDMKEAFKAE